MSGKHRRGQRGLARAGKFIGLGVLMADPLTAEDILALGRAIPCQKPKGAFGYCHCRVGMDERASL